MKLSANCDFLTIPHNFLSADHGGKLQLSTLFVAWVTFSVVSTIYTFYWDMRFDWGLNVVSDGKITPRREMIYSRRVSYCPCMSCCILPY